MSLRRPLSAIVTPLSRHAMSTWLGGILTYAAEDYRDELMSYQQMWTSARHEN